jgi:hypothetical protein
MVTSRPVPQSMAQIFSPSAGQYRSARRFSQIEHNFFSGNCICAAGKIRGDLPRLVNFYEEQMATLL